jgi:hypothetical protein
MPSGVHLPCSCLVISLLFQIVYRRQLRYIRTLWMKRWYRSLVSGSRLSTAFRYLDRQNIYYVRGTSAGCSKACFQSNTTWGGGWRPLNLGPLTLGFIIHNHYTLREITLVIMLLLQIFAGGLALMTSALE